MLLPPYPTLQVHDVVVDPATQVPFPLHTSDPVPTGHAWHPAVPVCTEPEAHPLQSALGLPFVQLQTADPPDTQHVPVLLQTLLTPPGHRKHVPPADACT